MVPRDTFVPRAKGTFVSPDGGVAKAIPPYTATPTSTSRRAKSDLRLMPFPFRTRLRSRERPQGHRSYNGSGASNLLSFRNEFLKGPVRDDLADFRPGRPGGLVGV